MTDRLLLRELAEEQERLTLAPWATRSSQATRPRPELECDIRPAFQHDRDRIIHSKAFRRLKHKTQVFLAPSGDHYRTRLTHTLEVSQIARTIARALRLNEDLTEAIALGHDLGHTPFGHAGERVLNELLPQGFRHAEQSLRVVDVLEDLNLTDQVRDGILKHSKPDGDPFCEDLPATLEGQVVRLADVIAYVNHDLDDAIRARIVSPQEVPARCRRTLGETHSQRINTMVHEVVSHSLERGTISVTPEVLEAMLELRGFLDERVYSSPQVRVRLERAERVLRELFEYLVERPDVFRQVAGSGYRDPSPERNVADFLAGMTDRYALALYARLFLPRPWAEEDQMGAFIRTAP